MAGLVEHSAQSSAGRGHAPSASSAGAALRFISPFDNLFAPVVASWPKSAHELTWLAPGTVAPLTPAKVCAWQRRDGRQFLFWESAADGPCGYGELNHMPDERRRYWIGHFVLDPAQRGRGLSHVFFRNLVVHAFEEMGAAEILLVVIPENVAAIKCYQRGGMIVSGRESKRFDATGQRHTFLRMSINRKRYDRLDAYRNVDAFRTAFVRSAVSMLNRQGSLRSHP
ncbi:MAG: GNAT family N-acetyltransferase [Phycisphaerales bacterium]|nr:GNAT family N-acetyltransferase [Phycisphaerales bacterium]MCB9856177.1 GNAT family N-acetyltransferase [Phycisphaerales bacterium]